MFVPILKRPYNVLLRLNVAVDYISYSGDPEFKSRSGGQLSRLKFFLSPLIQKPEWYHDRFPPRPSHSFIHSSSCHSTLHNLGT